MISSAAYKAYLHSPVGTILLEGDEQGISLLYFVDDAQDITPAEEIHASLKDALKQLEEYFAGTRQAFELLLNPEGTSFQKQVWKTLQEIPYGKTVSYLQQSRIIGNEKAIRAMASANGQNPIGIILPCHRVIGSDGSLTGYAGGLWRKEWLLKHEGALADKEQLSLF